MKRNFETVFRVAFLCIYATSMLVPGQVVGAGRTSGSSAVSELDPLSLEPFSLSKTTTAAGPEPAKGGFSIASQERFAGSDADAFVASGSISIDGSSSEERVNLSGGWYSPLRTTPAPPSSYYFYDGGDAGTEPDLVIEPITAYNLIVDSNVLSPSSYGPNSATLGAKYCNRTTSVMTDVWAYIGDYNIATPSSSTPGVYPIHDDTTDATFDSSFPHLATAPTAVDYGDPSRFYALEQEAGSVSDEQDASRYLGTLAAGECRTVYWLVSYPRKALISGSWVDVTGGVKPIDDLWLQYDFWGKVGSNYSYYTRSVTMRNEISAMANKIWPNGDNKVPDEYVAAIQQVLGWDTWTPTGGTGSTQVYPGETLIS